MIKKLKNLIKLFKLIKIFGITELVNFLERKSTKNYGSSKGQLGNANAQPKNEEIDLKKLYLQMFGILFLFFLFLAFFWWVYAKGYNDALDLLRWELSNFLNNLLEEYQTLSRVEFDKKHKNFTEELIDFVINNINQKRG